MKKRLLLLLVVTVVGIFINGSKENVAYASNSVGKLDNKPFTMSRENVEKFRAEFAYEMAKITAKVVTAPATDVEKFKIEFAYATAQVTAKVMPIIPNAQKNEFAYEMAQITTRTIIALNLNVEKAKAEFAYEIAQLTTKIITDAEKFVTESNIKVTPRAATIEPRAAAKVNNNTPEPNAALLRKNANIEPKATAKVNNTRAPDKKAPLLRNNANIELKTATKVNNPATAPKATVKKGDIAPETYADLIDELMRVGDRSNHSDNKVNIDGDIRYHYAANNGSGSLGRNSSGIRLYLGADTAINKDWRAYAMLEGRASILNYNNDFKLSRLYVAGKLGETTVKAGSFGYLMGEGNIYDSGFKGVRFDIGESLKYTLSYGETNYTEKTTVATARYTDFDYNLEAGIYHYQQDDGVRNTIRTLSGNYHFNDLSVGAMYLGSNLKDSKGNNNGYVFSLNHGDLKTYRPGTYNIFAKYYNQPIGTYISHGMNGSAGRMQGFKGYGLGMHYTFAENFVGGVEYYDLKDKVLGQKGDTWWNQLSYYF